MRRAVVLVALAVLAVFAGAKFVPWLLTKQDVELSSPTSPALFAGLTEVPLAPGHELCVVGVDLAPSYRSAHLLATGPGRLALTLSASGYSSTARAVAAAGPVAVALPVKPPPRDAIGNACLRNEGSAPLPVQGNVEVRTASRPVSTLDGRRIAPDVPLSFWRGKRETRLAALLNGIPKMAVFKPVGAWLFWVLLALVLIAVPAAVIAALAMGMRSAP
jgi:hypothetical protein